MRTNDSGDGAGIARTLANRNWLRAVWGNPLARDVDKWQAGVRTVLITLWIMVLPAAAVVGYLVSSDGVEQARAQAHSRIATTAVLTEAAPAMIFTASGAPVLGTTPVAARWAGSDGSTHVGTVLAQSGSVVGTTVDIFTDRSGALADPPLSASGAIITGLLVSLGMIMVCGVLLAGALKFCADTFDRRRSASWDRDWIRVAPLWFPQR